MCDVFGSRGAAVMACVKSCGGAPMLDTASSSGSKRDLPLSEAEPIVMLVKHP